MKEIKYKFEIGELVCHKTQPYMRLLVINRGIMDFEKGIVYDVVTYYAAEKRKSTFSESELIKYEENN